MNAKDYLSQVKLKDAIINNLIGQKENLNAMLYSISVSHSGERVQTSSNNSSKYEELFCKIAEKESEINKRIDELVNFKLEVCEKINRLTDPRYVSVLYKRYIEFKGWDVIAAELNYNVRYLFHVHGAALIAFKKVNLCE